MIDKRGYRDACDVALKALDAEIARKKADISGAANNPWDVSYRQELADLRQLVSDRRGKWEE